MLSAPLPGQGVVDDGFGIGAAGPDSGGRKNFPRRQVWLMNPFVGKSRQFRTPLADIVAVRIELLALADRVEYAEIGRGIRTATGGPLPAEGVLGEVGVHQRVPEPARAFLPRNQQVFDEETAAIIRTRLCIQPVAQNSRMPASTTG